MLCHSESHGNHSLPSLALGSAGGFTLKQRDVAGAGSSTMTGSSGGFTLKQRDVARAGSSTATARAAA